MSSEEEQFSHIENVPKPLKEQKSPYKDENAEEPEGPKPGLLHHIGDPVGQGLNAVLKPVGVPLGKLTEPVGNALGSLTKPALGPLMGKKEERMEAIGGDNKDSFVHGKDSVGGHLQTGDNPLGLNQTGSDKFRDQQ